MPRNSEHVPVKPEDVASAVNEEASGRDSYFTHRVGDMRPHHGLLAARSRILLESSVSCDGNGLIVTVLWMMAGDYSIPAVLSERSETDY